MLKDKLWVALMLPVLLLTSGTVSGRECIVVNEVLYCQQEQKVKVGGVELKVSNPREVLRKAKVSTGLKKVGLYDDYHFFPVVEELAKQNDMSYHEFVKFMAKNYEDDPNPFALLWDLEVVYDDLPAEYRPALVTIIRTQIEREVVHAIYVAFGISDTNRML